MKMKRRFAITIAFLLVALLAATLVACNFNDGNKPSGNVDDINNNDDTTTKDIVLRDDMTLEELKEVIKDVKSATVKTYDEDNQLIWEEYCKENVVISYNYGIEYPYMYDTEGYVLNGTKLYLLHSDDYGTEMTAIDYSGYNYDFSNISYNNPLFNILRYCTYDYAITNNTIIFKDIVSKDESFSSFGKSKIVISNLNSTEFAIPEVFANYKEEAEVRPMVEYEATPLENDDTKCKITNINCNDNFDLLKSIDIVVPETIDGRTVTELYGNITVYLSNHLEINLTIPSSVLNIGSYSWWNDCNSITVATGNPKYHSLNNCVIETESKTLVAGCNNSVIPNGVISIDNYAFSGCSGLTSITIPDSVTSIGNYAFSGCSGLTSVTIGNSVTSIGDFAFYECSGIISMTLGSGLTSIGKYAFDSCYKLVEVYNKSSLEIKAKNVYTTEGGSKLSIDNNGYEIYTDGEERILVAYHGTETDIVLPNDITAINQYAFYNCDELTSIVIPDSVTSIESGVFSNCRGLTSITMPNKVTSIGYKAFSGCSGLTSIVIPDSVTSIGGSAFEGCSGLTSITIPQNVKYLDTKAFSGCSNLTTVNWNATNCSYYSSYYTPLFYGCFNLTTVNMGNNVTAIPHCAFYRCYGLTNVTIPDSVTSIDSYAFGCCSGLTSVAIPDSVISIGTCAFQECTNLTNVTIGNGVKSIGREAFDDTAWYNNQPDGLIYIGKVLYKYKGKMPENTSITVEDGTKAITEHAFDGCSGLTSITIPNSVTCIDKNAFYGCSGLTSITIPNSVTCIDKNAFYGCSGLTTINFNGSIVEWHSIIKNEKWNYAVPNDCQLIFTDAIGSINSINSSNLELLLTSATSVTLVLSSENVFDSIKMTEDGIYITDDIGIGGGSFVRYIIEKDGAVYVYNKEHSTVNVTEYEADGVTTIDDVKKLSIKELVTTMMGDSEEASISNNIDTYWFPSFDIIETGNYRLGIYDINNTEFTIPSNVEEAINEYIASSQNENA